MARELGSDRQSKITHSRIGISEQEISTVKETAALGGDAQLNKSTHIGEVLHNGPGYERIIPREVCVSEPRRDLIRKNQMEP